MLQYINVQSYVLLQNPNQQTLHGDWANLFLKYQSICQELDYKFEQDINSGKIKFLPHYLLDYNMIESQFICTGMLPLILAVIYFESTPCRLVLKTHCQAPAWKPQNAVTSEKIKTPDV